MSNSQEYNDPYFEEVEKLKRENSQLQKKIRKKEKWLEKDERLAKKPREGRLVTANDLNDPAFKKKYPKARIGDEFNDPEPLFWKIGLKRPPTFEEHHAQVAAQFARQFRDEFGETEDDLLDEYDDDALSFTEGEVTAFLHQSAMMDAQASTKKLPPAEQSSEAANGVEPQGEGTAKQKEILVGGE